MIMNWHQDCQGIIRRRHKTVVRPQDECFDRPVTATPIASQESGFPVVYFSDGNFKPVNNCTLQCTSLAFGAAHQTYQIETQAKQRPDALPPAEIQGTNTRF